MNEAVARNLRRINRGASEGTTRENDGVRRRQGRKVERTAHARGTVTHRATREDIGDLGVDAVDGDGTRAEGGRITSRRNAGVDDSATTVGIGGRKGQVTETILGQGVGSSRNDARKGQGILEDAQGTIGAEGDRTCEVKALRAGEADVTAEGKRVGAGRDGCPRRVVNRATIERPGSGRRTHGRGIIDVQRPCGERTRSTGEGVHARECE